MPSTCHTTEVIRSHAPVAPNRSHSDNEAAQQQLQQPQQMVMMKGGSMQMVNFSAGQNGEAVVWVPVAVPAQWRAAAARTLPAQQQPDDLWETTWDTFWGPPNWPLPGIGRPAARVVDTWEKPGNGQGMIGNCGGKSGSGEDTYEPRSGTQQQQQGTKKKEKKEKTSTTAIAPAKSLAWGTASDEAISACVVTTTENLRKRKDAHEPCAAVVALKEPASGAGDDDHDIADVDQQEGEEDVAAKKRNRRQRRKNKGSSAAAPAQDEIAAAEDSSTKGAALLSVRSSERSSSLQADCDEPQEDGEGGDAISAPARNGQEDGSSSGAKQQKAPRQPLPPTELIEVEGKMVPSVGSAEHEEGTCKRCCFFPKGRCRNGTNCEFCHFDHEPRKRVKRTKKAAAQEGEEEEEELENSSNSHPGEEEEQEEEDAEQRQEQESLEDTSSEMDAVLLPAEKQRVEQTTAEEQDEEDDEERVPPPPCPPLMVLQAVLSMPEEDVEPSKEAALLIATPSTMVLSKAKTGAKEEPQCGEDEQLLEDEEVATTFAEDESEPEGEAPSASGDYTVPSSSCAEESSCSPSEEEDEEVGPPHGSGSEKVKPFQLLQQQRNSATPVVRRIVVVKSPGPQQKKSPPAPQKEADHSSLVESALKILRYFEDDGDLGSACRDWQEQIMSAPEEQAKAALRSLLAVGLEDSRKATATKGLASGLLEEGCVAKAGMRKVLKDLKKTGGLLEDFAVDNPKAAELFEELEDLAKKSSKVGQAAATTPAKSTTPPWRRTPRLEQQQDQDQTPQKSPRPLPATKQQPVAPKAAVAAAEPVEANVSSSSPGGSPTSNCSPTKTAATKDAEVARAIKSILNKLTVEKFDRLTEKLLTCGLSTAEHLEILTAEVFEKATTQHHFIDMYSDLCVRVEAHVVAKGGILAGSEEQQKPLQFRKILLNECQRCFERCLSAPGGTSPKSRDIIPDVDKIDKEEAQKRYKTRMLGNIKFVGHLLAKKMLASRVLLMVGEELLGHGDEALELLAAFLTICGPTFDLDATWSHRPHLRDIFDRLRKRAADPLLSSRLRCLVQDLLDLRNAGWDGVFRKAGQAALKREAPRKLSEVRQEWQRDQGMAADPAALRQ